MHYTEDFILQLKVSKMPISFIEKFPFPDFQVGTYYYFIQVRTHTHTRVVTTSTVPRYSK